MNQEVKKLWLNELRSGQRKQATGMLCRVDKETKECSYCCLGVLTDLYLEQHNLDWIERDGYKSFEYNSSWLHEDVVKWAGLDRPNPYAGSTKLSYLNDNGQTFEQIADLIEENL